MRLWREFFSLLVTTGETIIFQPPRVDRTTPTLGKVAELQRCLRFGLSRRSPLEFWEDTPWRGHRKRQPVEVEKAAHLGSSFVTVTITGTFDRHLPLLGGKEVNCFPPPNLLESPGNTLPPKVFYDHAVSLDDLQHP